MANGNVRLNMAVFLRTGGKKMKRMQDGAGPPLPSDCYGSVGTAEEDRPEVRQVMACLERVTASLANIDPVVAARLIAELPPDVAAIVRRRVDAVRTKAVERGASVFV